MTSPIDFSVIELLRGFRENGEPDPIIELRTLFIEDGSRHLQVLNEAIAAGDDRAARRAVHSLVGMCGTIGALQLCSLSSEVAKAEPGAIDRARFEQLESEFQRVSEALLAA